MSNAGNLANFATNVNPTGDINVGVITATSSINVGTGVTISSSGIITASAFYGDGSNLSNLSIPASFNELDAALFN